MACLKMRLVSKRNGEVVSAPCGQCLACRLERQTTYEFIGNMAAIEAYSAGKGVALCTLTYDEAHVPLVYYSRLDNKKSYVTTTLRPRDLTNFFKRLRYYVNMPLRYIACGEYGGSTADKRPHYHFLLYGVYPEVTKKNILKAWTDGFCQCGTLTDGGVRYVVDYVVKQQFGQTAKAIYTECGRYRPFFRVSSHLGLRAMLSVIDFSDWTYMCRGVKRSVPFGVREKMLATVTRDDWKRSVIVKARDLGFKNPSDYLTHQAETYAHDYFVRCRQKGVPVEDFQFSTFVDFDYISSLASSAIGS